MKKLTLILLAFLVCVSSCSKDEQIVTGTPPDTPQLSSPTNNAVDQSVSPTLRWSTSNGATSYSLQVSIGNTFESNVFDQSGLTSTNKVITGLSNSATYYWRVKATNSNGSSNWSGTWSFTTVGTAPSIPGLISPTDGAIDQTNSPVLTWNASNGTTYYVLHVSTSSTFGSFAFNDSTLTGVSRQLSSLLNSTKYYWRVRAKNSYGTSGWSGTWSFTTTGVTPSIPVLNSPTDGSTGQSTSPTLRWNTSSGAMSYSVQVSTSGSFASLIYDRSGITATNQQVTGLSNLETYYWRVKATNNYGTSDWSGPWSFATTGLAPSIPIQQSPANAAAGQSIAPTFMWDASSGASTYALQVSTSSSFTTYFYNQSGLTATSQQVTGLSNLTTYYWRMNATNSYGTSSWSPVWSFATTGLVPSVPVLSSPSDGSTGQATLLTVRWNAGSGASSYALQVSMNSSFAGFVYNDSGLIATSRQLSGLSNSTTYYWRVKATNNYGTSDWSGPWSFATIGTAPPVAVLLLPADAASGQSTSPNLTWNASSGASSYTLQVSTTNTFASYFFNQSGITGTTQQVTGLTNLSTYYWRVKATNSFGSSIWSTVWGFTTTGLAPSIPALSSPANAVVGQSTSPTLTWNASSGATTYALQVCANTSFTSLAFDKTGLTATSQQVTGLSNLTTYYWRVNAMNSYGASDWSTMWNFKTSAAASLDGYAYYAGTTIPVSGVTVSAQGVSLTTSSNGYYKLDNLVAGATTLTAIKDGYDSYTTPVTLLGGSNTKSIPMTSALYTHNLYGTIASASTLQPLQSVAVTVLNDNDTPSQLTTTSDFSGHYQIPTVPQGQRKVRFSKQNFQTFTASIFMSNSDYPFDVQLANKPAVPSNPSPGNMAIRYGSFPFPTLTWDCVDPNGDPTTFDVYFDSLSTPTRIVSPNQTTRSYAPSFGNFRDGQTYYWKIVAKDGSGNSTSGPIWSFTMDYRCEGLPSISYGGRNYSTVQIGGRCWMKENLDIGTMLTTSSSNPSNNGSIEKWCFNSNPAYCAQWGGLYQWAEAMGYATTPGAQGICPSGWHIPTIEELNSLKNTISQTTSYTLPALLAVGEGEGTGTGNNRSGFGALLANCRYPTGWQTGSPEYGYVWSSTQIDASNANDMYLQGNSQSIYYSTRGKDYGFSIRCIKN